MTQQMFLGTWFTIVLGYLIAIKTGTLFYRNKYLNKIKTSFNQRLKYTIHQMAIKNNYSSINNCSWNCFTILLVYSVHCISMDNSFSRV